MFICHKLSTTLHSLSLFQHYIDQNDDIKVQKFLKRLSKEDLQKLFRELGLSTTTVANNYEGSSVYKYGNDLIQKWIRGDDEAKKKGGATWENLNAALEAYRIGISSEDD